MEQLQLQPDLTFSFEIRALVILGALNYPVKNVSSASQVRCGCEQILLAFATFVSCSHAVLGFSELCCFCSQRKLALRDTGMSALLARGSMSCII